MRSEKEQRANEIVWRFLAFERAALDVEHTHRAIIVAALDCVTEGETGRERVTANALPTKFPGHCPRHRDDGAFRRYIVQHHWRALEHRARNDIDDIVVA